MANTKRYKEKNELLKSYVPEVTPMDFYRDMFPEGSFEEQGRQDQGKANGILCSVVNGTGNHRLVFDDLKEIENHLKDDFVIISPIAYFGRRRSAYNASMLYGFCFDLDDVDVPQLKWILDRLENKHFPRATYIANSGNGLHLYYLLDKPIPLYKSIHKRLNDLKHDLTDLIWNKYTSKIDPQNKQYQGIFQGFRMVGSKTKIGNNKIRVFKTGFKISIDYLNQFVVDEYKVNNLEYESSLSLEEAKQKYPDWYDKRILNGQPKGKWNIKRDLYDWWIRKVLSDDKLTVGHRYFCIAVLASYAVKCGIDEDQLRKDAYSLKDRMNNLQRDFTDDDIESALNFYQESFINLPREEIKKISGLDMPINKRNGRTQELHLAGARAVQKINDEFNGTNWRDGNGRKPKRNIVIEWRKNNPNGKPKECIKETGLNKNTVYKWWK